MSAGLGGYRALLASILEGGYEIRPLGAWVRDRRDAGRTVLLRHDVDGRPRAARRMADIEADLGVSGTWYVRWRTADPGLVEHLRTLDLEVGLHYESLSRLGHRVGATTPSELEPLEPIAAAYLEAEIRVFAHRFGSCPSVCPHGDTSLPAARNADLLRLVDTASLGVDFDARAAMAEASRAGWAWLTDDGRSSRRGMPPESDPLAHDSTRIMLVIHPNNWVRGRWRGGSGRGDEPPC